MKYQVDRGLDVFALQDLARVVVGLAVAQLEMPAVFSQQLLKNCRPLQNSGSEIRVHSAYLYQLIVVINHLAVAFLDGDAVVVVSLLVPLGHLDAVGRRVEGQREVELAGGRAVADERQKDDKTDRHDVGRVRMFSKSLTRCAQIMYPLPVVHVSDAGALMQCRQGPVCTGRILSRAPTQISHHQVKCCHCCCLRTCWDKCRQMSHTDRDKLAFIHLRDDYLLTEKHMTTLGHAISATRVRLFLT